MEPWQPRIHKGFPHGCYYCHCFKSTTLTVIQKLSPHPLSDSGCWFCPQQFCYLSEKAEWWSPLHLGGKEFAKLSMRTQRMHGSSYTVVAQSLKTWVSMPALPPSENQSPIIFPPRPTSTLPSKQMALTRACALPLSTLYLGRSLPWHLPFSTQHASLKSVPQAPLGLQEHPQLAFFKPCITDH